MKKIFIILYILNLQVQAQGGFRSRIYLPGAPDQQAKAVFEVSPGKYFAGGFAADTAGFSQEINKLTVMDLDDAGKLGWYKQYGNSKFIYKNNPLIMRSYYKQGNFIYYAGCVQDTTNKQIGVLICFDLNGDTLWQKVYRDPDPQEDVIPQMLTGSIDGGFLITGFFQHWGNNTRNGLLIKTDSNGNEIWRRKLSKAFPDVQDGKAIIQDSATNKIVIVGYQYLTTPGNHGNILILDSLGNEMDHQAFIQGVVHDVVQLADKSFLLVGYTEILKSDNNMYYRSYIARFRLNSGPVPLWKIQFLPEALSTGFGCARVLYNGDVLIMGWLGETDTINFTNNDQIRVTRIDSTGTVKWDKLYDYKFNSASSHFYSGARAFEPTSDGGWIAAIELFNNPGPNPFFFVKYDSTGCDSTTDYCESLVEGLQNDDRISSFSFQMLPNPATITTKIVFSSEPGKFLDMRITDVAGKEVLLQKEISTRSEIDLSVLQNGLYFVALCEDEQPVTTKKLIVQR